MFMPLCVAWCRIGSQSSRSRKVFEFDRNSVDGYSTTAHMQGRGREEVRIDLNEERTFHWSMQKMQEFAATVLLGGCEYIHITNYEGFAGNSSNEGQRNQTQGAASSNLARGTRVKTANEREVEETVPVG